MERQHIDWQHRFLSFTTTMDAYGHAFQNAMQRDRLENYGFQLDWTMDAMDAMDAYDCANGNAMGIRV